VAGNDLLQKRGADLSAANAFGNDIVAIAAGAGKEEAFYQLLEDVSCLSLCTARHAGKSAHLFSGPDDLQISSSKMTVLVCLNGSLCMSQCMDRCASR